MSQVSVTINGKIYRMACEEGQEEHLIGLAEKFDGYIRNLKGSFGEIGDQRLTIMAGVMIVDELRELQKKIGKLENDLEITRSSRDREIASRDDREKSILSGLEKTVDRLDALTSKLNR